MTIRLAVVAGLLAALCLALPADTVYLNSGKKLVGTVVKKDGKTFMDVPGKGMILLNDADVSYIVPGVSESQPAASEPAAEDTTPPAVVIKPALTWNINNAALPDMAVFMIARAIEVAAPDSDTETLRNQLKTGRADAHEGKRRLRDLWLPRDEQRRRRAEFDKHMQTAVELLRQSSRAPAGVGVNPADVAIRKKKLEAQVLQECETAAAAWPDSTISEFLKGLVDYNTQQYKLAEAHFRRCAEEEPLVAAYHQGRAMSLAALKQPLQAVAEYALTLDLRDDQADILTKLEEACKDVPANQVAAPAYRKAQAVIDRYEKPKAGFRAFGGMTWLMPGKGLSSREELLLPAPTYDRIICRQGLGVPVAEDLLLVDSAIVAGAEQVYVQVTPDVLLRGELVRQNLSYSSNKIDLPLAQIRVTGATFKPLDIAHPAELQVNDTPTIKTANFYRQMGTDIRSFTTSVKEATADKNVLSPMQLPGEGLGVVLAGDRFAGLLTGRTQVDADDCGKAAWMKSADLSALATQIKKSSRSNSFRSGMGLMLKADAPRQTSSDPVFMVYVLAGENPPAPAGK